MSTASHGGARSAGDVAEIERASVGSARHHPATPQRIRTPSDVGANAATTEPRLCARGLVKVFGSRPRDALALVREGCGGSEIRSRTGCTVAVRDVSVEIETGELFVIMGLSGSGKSTLIRMLNRLVEPTAGVVSVGGMDIATLTDSELRKIRNQRVSMVFQHFAIFPHRTVQENVAYGLHVRGAADAERRERSEWALDTVGLSGWGNMRPAELSGGMKQRVGLARALATDAEVMLMDEPFSALDPLTRRDMQDLLVRLQQDLRRTIVFVTHDLNEAMRIGDRITIMKDGELVQTGRAAEVLSVPADDYVASFTADVDRSRVLTARDVMRASSEPQTIEEGVPTVKLETPLAELCGLFADGSVALLAVADAREQLVGTVSVTAALGAVATGLSAGGANA